MIYLQIEIRRDTFLDFFKSEHGIAELMFRSDNMDDCIQRATAILKKTGWKSGTVLSMEEGYRIDDFHTDYRLQCLFYEAREKGVACAITTHHDLEEAATTWQAAASL
jgi:hypothetical protein